MAKNIIRDGLIVNSDGVFLNTEKIQYFKGIEINYSGNISISCSWCNKIDDMAKIVKSKGAWVGAKSGFVLAANNKTGKIIIFSVNNSKEKRMMQVGQMKNSAKLFDFALNGKYSASNRFSIRSAILVDDSDERKFLYPKYQSEHFRSNDSTWDTLAEGSSTWSEYNKEIQQSSNAPNISRKNVNTDWEITNIKSTPISINRKKIKQKTKHQIKRAVNN